jgi:cysteine desulfurase / selenocysteine lyase
VSVAARDVADTRSGPTAVPGDARWRGEFPIFDRPIHGRPLVYLDSAATTQKPRAVIERLARYYAEGCANVHRGLYALSAEATEEFEGVREHVARFLGAASSSEIVFTSGTTAAINLVAHGFGARFVRAGDEILVTEMEHHSNLVPWQLLCSRAGARLRAVPFDDTGRLSIESLDAVLSDKTRLLAVTHTSNALGTRNPLPQLIATARARGVPVLVDAAQAIAHERLDVRALDCDLLAFSGHKAYGPTGVGVLYGKRALLDELPPFLGGGEMIERVRLESSTFKEPPHRFEAGTPPIAGVLGLGAAIEWIERAGLDALGRHDEAVARYASERLQALPRVRLVGTAPDKGPIVSFVVDGVHPHDVAQWLDGAGIAVRAGHHCAQPALERLGLGATVRASFACYNTCRDVDTLAEALGQTIEVLG